MNQITYPTQSQVLQISFIRFTLPGYNLTLDYHWH